MFLKMGPAQESGFFVGFLAFSLLAGLTEGKLLPFFSLSPKKPERETTP
jgi:hypothetical protein